MQIGRLIVATQAAQDCWTYNDRSGNVMRQWFGIQTLKACDGPETALVIVLHKLSVSIAWITPNVLSTTPSKGGLSHK